MEKRSYKKGNIIFREGDRDRVLYIVEEGRVAIYLGYGTSQERLLTYVDQGKCFGEMSVFEYKKRSATAIASEDTRLLAVSDAEFDILIKTHPDIVYQIYQNRSHRLRELSESCEEARDEVREYLLNERDAKISSGSLMKKIKGLTEFYKRFR